MPKLKIKKADNTDKKISDLNEVTSIDDLDEIAIVQGGETKKGSMLSAKSYTNSGFAVDQFVHGGATGELVSLPQMSFNGSSVVVSSSLTLDPGRIDYANPLSLSFWPANVVTLTANGAIDAGDCVSVSIGAGDFLVEKTATSGNIHVVGVALNSATNVGDPISVTGLRVVKGKIDSGSGVTAGSALKISGVDAGRLTKANVGDDVTGIAANSASANSDIIVLVPLNNKTAP